LFLSVAQNIFTNRLVARLEEIPGVDPRVVLEVGGTNLLKIVDPKALTRVQRAYNDALTNSWYVAVALAALSILGAIVLEWTQIGCTGVLPVRYRLPSRPRYKSMSEAIPKAMEPYTYPGQCNSQCIEWLTDIYVPIQYRPGLFGFLDGSDIAQNGCFECWAA
jgi:hypothetical protein